MPKIKSESPEQLRPYLFHGLDLGWDDHGAIGDCPWCGREGKFAVDLETGKWVCRVCREGGENGGGNIYTFLRLLWEASDRATTDYHDLAEDRGLSPDTLIHWGLARSSTTGDWLVPGYNAKGSLCQLYRRVQRADRSVLLPTPGLGHQIHGIPPLVGDASVVYVCYSSDTEVLTQSGWNLFSSLAASDNVAAWHQDGSITYETPMSRQVFDYAGDLLHFKSDWCDLLVTKDHRMICKYASQSSGQVRFAKDVKPQQELPVSGISAGIGGPTESEVRLLVAFVADGCVRRGYQIEFGIYKHRKTARLKSLLEKTGVPFRIANYSRPGQSEYIIIDRRDAPFLLHYCPKKTWTGDEVNWSVKTRSALIDELKYWDGDSGVHNCRYFTSKPSEAEIISRVLVTSGYSSQVREVASRRAGHSNEYIVSYMHRAWRRLTKKSREVNYSGKVYCCTVSSGFLVVRRKGKAVVSGNCEGPWDAMALWEALGRCKETEDGGLAATASVDRSLLADASVLAVPGCGTFMESWLPLFEGRSVVLMYDNDHPRVHPKTGKIIEPAAWSGMRRATGMLAGVAGEVRVLAWGGDADHDPSLPSGFDVRDMLSGPDGIISTDLLRLFARVGPVPESWSRSRRPANGKRSGTDVSMRPLACVDYRTLVTSWRKAMRWTDGLDHALACTLAVIISTPMVGDQLWMKVISPAASGKTTVAEAISVDKKHVKAISTLRGMHSGFREEGGDKEDNSLLSLIFNKTLVIKDGDTLLKAPNLEQILSEMRDVYDGTSRTHYRNKASKDYEGIRLTVILCGTNSLRQIDSSELGERFLDCVIMEGIDDDLEDEILDRVVHRAARDVAVESDGEVSKHYPRELAEAMRLTGGYVGWLRDHGVEMLSKVVYPDGVRRMLTRLGKFTAFMRARPSIRQEEVAEREFATRLVSQLTRLAGCLAVVLNRGEVDAEVMRRVRQVAMDTGRGRTMAIVSHLHDSDDGLESRSLAMLVGQTEDKTRVLLRFLRAIGAVEAYQPTEGKKTRVHWRLTVQLSRLYREVMTVENTYG